MFSRFAAWNSELILFRCYGSTLLYGLFRSIFRTVALNSRVKNGVTLLIVEYINRQFFNWLNCDHLQNSQLDYSHHPFKTVFFSSTLDSFDHLLYSAFAIAEMVLNGCLIPRNMKLQIQLNYNREKKWKYMYIFDDH